MLDERGLPTDFKPLMPGKHFDSPARIISSIMAFDRTADVRQLMEVIRHAQEPVNSHAPVPSHSR